MIRAALFGVALLGAALPGGVAPALAAPPDPVAVMRALRDADVRVETIGSRLAIANRAMCAGLAPRTGLLLQDIRQFPPANRAAARAVFGFARDIAVEAVVPDSPAARAGLATGMAPTAIDGRPIDAIATPQPGEAPGFARLASVLDALDAAPGAVTIDYVDAGGKTGRAVVHPQAGCRTRFQLMLSGGNAQADGRYVQIDGGLYDAADSDDALAAVMAHELAHNILDHRARLDAAGSRATALVRRTEEEADRLSIHLLLNAGFDPGRGIAFWGRYGGRYDLGIFPDPTHGNSRTRMRKMRAEWAVAKELRARTPAGEPIIPDFARRPFTPLR